MHPVEIEDCLRSMEVLVDTREQPSAKYRKRMKALSVPYTRKKLEYGDYTYTFTLPDGRKLYEDSDMINPPVVIERKMSLEELSGNLCQQRKRFEQEFLRAIEHDARIYLLVENANFEKLYAGHYKTGFHPNAFVGSLFSLCARYKITPIFCKEEMSGKIIHDILYRELKEKLRSGYYG